MDSLGSRILLPVSLQDRNLLKAEPLHLISNNLDIDFHVVS
jgi:hypothetical protein